MLEMDFEISKFILTVIINNMLHAINLHLELHFLVLLTLTAYFFIWPNKI